jgi:FkbM family methyltransferase
LFAEHLISQGNIQTFVQVGSNDGIHNDVLYPLLCKYELKGLLIEPQPGPANRLRELHSRNNDITIVEMAVAQSACNLKLWRACGEGLINGVKTDALTSFNRSQLEAQLTARGLNLRTEAFEVEAADLKTILQVYELTSPNLVVIDTEGMDHLIVQQLNLKESPPVMIQFESCHIPSYWLETIREHLKNSGYLFVLTERDVIAIHQSVVKQIDTAFSIPSLSP